jgi:hypothetical protein
VQLRIPDGDVNGEIWLGCEPCCCHWSRYGTYDDIIGFELVWFAFETFRAKSIASNESPIQTFNIPNVDLKPVLNIKYYEYI